MSAHRERNSRSSAAADAAAAAAAAATPPAPVPSHAAASASGPASILVGSPLRKAMQASVKLIGAGAFLVYMLGGAEKFAFLTSGGAERPWFLLDAPSCVMLALLLAYVPHWIRTFGVVRPKLARAGTPYDLRYTRLCTQNATDTSDEGLLIARLTGCHQNGLEAFAFFGVAVAMALTLRVYSGHVDAAATFFIASRVVYTVIYCTGTQEWKGPARSVVWATGFIACLWLMSAAAASYRASLSKK